MAYIREEPPSAHWMHRDGLKDDAFTMAPGKILLGHGRERLVGLDDNRHLVTIAGSRAGKSATSLMSNLRTWTGSVLAIDPKGELATNTARYREAMGQEVHIIDPFGVVKGDAKRWVTGFNPMMELATQDAKSHVDDAALLADSLVVAEGGNTDHWHLSAKNLIQGLLLWILDSTERNQDPPTLTELRDLLSLPMQGDDGTPSNRIATMEGLFSYMGMANAYDGVIANVGNSYKGKPAGERGSIISTAIEQTAFLRSSALTPSLANSSFSLGDLKTKAMTVYLVLPASRMATHFRWLRVIISQAMTALERVENDPGKPPVLFILEEFPTLGYMRQLETAAGLMAGFQVKLWSVMQDISQLKSLYPRSWETFLGNAGILEAFGNADASTTEYLSKRIGMTLSKVIQSTEVGIRGQQAGDSPEREVIQTSPLLAPFEITRLFSRDTERKLVLVPEYPPFSVRRVLWTDERLGD